MEVGSASFSRVLVFFHPDDRALAFPRAKHNGTPGTGTAWRAATAMSVSLETERPAAQFGSQKQPGGHPYYPKCRYLLPIH